MNTIEKLNVEQAAEQLDNYLYPKGRWIGTYWIQGNVLQELAGNLKDAIIRAEMEKHLSTN